MKENFCIASLNVILDRVHFVLFVECIALRTFHCFSSLLCLLASELVCEKLSEIVDDDGNGQSNYQNATNTANASNESTAGGARYHISVADGRHCHNCPPKCSWNRRELSVGFVFFYEIHQRRENHDEYAQKQHDHSQFPVRITQGKPKRLQAVRMPGQFQNSQQTQYANDVDQNAPWIRLCWIVLGYGFQYKCQYVVRENGHQIDDVEASLDEFPFAWRHSESHQIFEREPIRAHGFDRGQILVVLDNAIDIIIGLKRGQCVE